MRIAGYFGVLGLALVCSAPTSAAQKFGCYERFLEADADRNGALSEEEDKAGYFKAFDAKGLKPLAPKLMSRDEFVRACESGAFSSVSEAQRVSPEGAPDPGAAGKGDSDLPKDLGKGDITPGVQKLPENVARSRLRENGFADVGPLKLDADGVWRGTAVVNGKRVDVAVDPQGDIVGGH